MNFSLNDIIDSIENNFSNQLKDSNLFLLFDNCYRYLNHKLFFLSDSNFHKFIGFINIVVMAIFVFCLGAPQFATDKGYFGVIVLVGFALSFVFNIIQKNNNFKFSIIDFLVLVYFATNIISTFASAYFITSLNGLAKLAIFVLSYFWFRLTINSKNSNYFVNEIVFLAFIMSLYGLYQYKIGVKALATWEDPTLDIHQTRIFSTLGNPNLLAGFLTPILFLNLSLLANSLSKKKLLRAIVYLISTITIFVAVVLTGCRGVYLALPISILAVCVVLYFVFIRNLSLKKIFITSLVLFLLAIASSLIALKIPYVKDRFSTIFSGREHSSNSYRLNVWQSSLKMLKDNYVFGIGPGNKTFRLAYGLYMKSGFDALGTYCVPLEIAVENGILGIAAFILLLKMYSWQLHRHFWQDLISKKRINWLTLGILGALIAMMLHGLVDTVFFRPQINFIFWILLCLNLY